MNQLQPTAMGRREDGASLVEYGLLVALIALVCFAAVLLLGSSTGGSLSGSASEVGSAVSG